MTAAGGWGWWLLGGSAMSEPALRSSILLATALASAALLWSWGPRRRHVAPVMLAVGLAAALGGPAAFALATVDAPHQGIGPSVGPPRTGFAMRTVSNPRTRCATRGDGHSVVRRHRSVDVRCRPRIGNGDGGDGDRRLLRHRSGADPAAVSGRRRRASDRVLPRAARRIARRRRRRVQDEVVSPRAHADIRDWVRGHFQSTTVGGVTAYDLFAPMAPERYRTRRRNSVEAVKTPSAAAASSTATSSQVLPGVPSRSARSALTS